MSNLIIEPQRCRVEGEDDVGLLWALNRELAYEVQGAQFTRAYKVGYMDPFKGEFVTWDGKNCFLEDDLSFPAGLQQRVISFYKKLNKPLHIIDNRPPKTEGMSIDILSTLNKMGKHPRPYQLKAMEATRNADRGIIRIPTGGGKCTSIDSLHITEDGLLDYSEMLNGVTLNDNDAMPYFKTISTSERFNNTDVTSMIYHDGYGDAKKITTSFGYIQTATPNHKIQVMDINGNVIWKSFKDLKLGDYAVIVYNNMMFGKQELNLDEAYKYGSSFNEQINCIPKFIRTLKKEPLSMFIRGLYETYGWVDKEKFNTTICIALPNKKTTDQLHLLLLNFGVVASRILQKNILTIHKSYVSQFIKEIGFNSKKINLETSHINNIIPNQSIKLKKLLHEIPHSLFDNCDVKWDVIQSWIDKRNINPTKNDLIILLDFLICNNIKKDQCIEIKKDIQNVFFDEIIMIEDTFTDNYDFVVPNTHSFVSQGFVNHNTLVSSLITADIGKKTIVYVIGKDLLHQLHGFFKNVFDGIDIGIIGDGKCEIGDINVASVWTVGQVFGLKKSEIILSENDEETAPEPEHFSKIRDLLTEAKTHIIDECHVAACETIQTIVHNINPEHIYGMSASPWRDDGADLLIECVLGHRIVDVDASYLIKNNWLVKPFIKFVKVPPYHTKLKKQYQTIYKNYIVENEVRNGMVVKSAAKMVERGYKPLILFNSIKHGKILEDMLSKQIRCTLLSGKDKMSVREQAKDDIENNKIDAIIASKIFDIGVDIPVLSGLIIAGSGKSSVRALQRIGRVIRPYGTKKYAAVVDFIDNAHYLSSHSKTRCKIYKSESGFDVNYPLDE